MAVLSRTRLIPLYSREGESMPRREALMVQPVNARFTALLFILIPRCTPVKVRFLITTGSEVLTCIAGASPSAVTVNPLPSIVKPLSILSVSVRAALPWRTTVLPD